MKLAIGPVWIVSILIVLSLVILVSTVSQSHAAPVRFDCEFDRSASPKGGLKTLDKLFKFAFVMDSTTHDAAVIGNAGVSPVKTVTGSEAITFLETLPTGIVQSTTIIASTWEAVHSRHTFLSLNSEFAPSQYYGSCKFIKLAE